MSERPVTDRPEAAYSAWEGGFDRVVEWAPYATLAISLVLDLLDAPTWNDRLISIGLSAGAALWCLFMFTLPQHRRQEQGWVRVYFAGLMVFAALLMFHQFIFFIFVITGFIHAFLLKPAAAGFVGVGITSLIVNSGIVYPEASADQWWTYGIIVVIQTVAVGFGIVGGERIGNLSEQRRRSLIELEAVLEENAGLHAQLVAQAREAGIHDERQRIAGEIHDTIAQGLTGVITQLEAASRIKDDPIELQRRLDNATDLARASLDEARRTMRAVLPAPLEDRHLPDALADEAARWSTLSQVPVDMVTTGEAHGLHPEVEVTMLRVVQEALANVAKHADASRVGVTLSYMGDVVTVDVRDDGTGLSHIPSVNGADVDAGFGLVAMRQRVERLAGTLEIESDPGRGTAVSATLPAIPLDPSNV
jgi:signal transduction histidine kinase